ncbi:hypothetical protein G6F62_009010 [Rhizopus arrhizus]|uniref:Uncharacterized protein n=1 Tax=Rhizopus oryzae TaxID=64495 RepID=A0A9P6X1U4_RHIOR|nr:hypothetical protein G6F23_008784 [Rhizopus arrhizus]KAG0787604.1 hypothetical protein G6F21_007794 [Rhizopus arrhizus]KAG0792365.1 hypothetical protein G6F22_005884 [Rhizopus arrhizus]KAG0809726.1 hypothetical protein G6F20_008544 [Rhizopus arrhizus]KAG0823750.1 hypothetical protein G6F19_010701 [Rhizopus arrhizus]
MPTFTSTISRMKSVKLSFKKNPKDEQEQEEQQTSNYVTPEYQTTSVLPVSSKSFSEALNVISQEVKNTQFNDVFDCFFFNDKRCQHRALFMTARLKQSLDMNRPLRTSTSTPIKTSSTAVSRTSLDNTVEGFWRLITHRLYTLNYILFVLPSDSSSRAEFLKRIETDLTSTEFGKTLLSRRGGMEAHFAVRYALQYKKKLRRRKTLLEDAFEQEKRKGGNVAGAVLPSVDPSIETNNKTVEQARVIIEQCLESESKLGHSEKDAMYVFHSLRAGLLDAFQPHIELEEDRALRHRLKRAVDENKEKLAYQNPFEDEDCIVTEEDVSSVEETKREIDSGFYDGWVPTNAM